MVLKQAYEIDEIGFINEIRVVEFDDEGKLIGELPIGYIMKSPPDGLYRAKWNGVEWVEGLSQTEIDDLNNQSIQLSDNQLLGQYLSEREIQEIIQGQQISDLEIRMLMGGL